jgi:sensor histidine kinase YesM
VLIWLIYVGIYKYSYLLDHAGLPHVPGNNFPYLSVCLYGICTTLYLVPYYRWAVPKLLDKKRYWWLLFLSMLLLTLINFYNCTTWGWLFAQFTQGRVVHQYFTGQYKGQILDLNMVLTDLLAFFCIAFARYSYQNEQRRRQIETDHLQLQLGMLKAQLQPHFLFNTLNGLYGMSLTGSSETPRFILLLSQMMQYILYDCDQERVSLHNELAFLQGYFELEQKKFPEAEIRFDAPELKHEIHIPPLLFLPLVENSFKHGRHKLEDTASVQAVIKISAHQLVFCITNEVLTGENFTKGPNRSGGIGLINIKRRLELYYPGRHEFTAVNDRVKYTATVTIQYK